MTEIYFFCYLIYIMYAELTLTFYRTCIYYYSSLRDQNQMGDEWGNITLSKYLFMNLVNAWIVL